MIIVQVHNFSHRLIADGRMESAPVGRHLNPEWQQRAPESMGMSGGDYDFILQHLRSLVEVFKDRIEPLPFSTPAVQPDQRGERPL